MEREARGPEPYDFRQYDHIWQRVAPGLEPYPAADRAAVPAGAVPAAAETGSAGAALTAESRLPGAEQNPCCMGSAAVEELAVLAGFIEEALEDRRACAALARQAPVWARRQLLDMAAEQEGHARRLMAAYYLIQGTCYRPVPPTCPVRTEGWCAALRTRYHAAACNGLNYARAGEETTDPCLSRLLEELSGEEYRRADRLMGLLERSLRG